MDDILARMAAANFCATMAFGLLLIWALMEFIEWSSKRPAPGGRDLVSAARQATPRLQG